MEVLSILTANLNFYHSRFIVVGDSETTMEPKYETEVLTKGNLTASPSNTFLVSPKMLLIVVSLNHALLHASCSGTAAHISGFLLFGYFSL